MSGDRPLPFAVTLAAGALLGWLTLRALRPLATRLGLLDQPGPRKLQTEAVPLLGGAMLAAGLGGSLAFAALLHFLVGSRPWVPTAAVQAWPWLRIEGSFLLLLFAVGLLDDVVPGGLRASVKSALTIVALGWFLTLHDVPRPLLTLPIGFLVLHAWNITDNAHGLCGGIALVGLAAFSLPWLCDLPVTPDTFPGRSTLVAAALLAGALLVFLWFNFPRGRIFLGDGGSLLLGGFLVTPFLLSARPEWLLVSAVPLADLVTVSWLRLRRGQAPWIGDLGHVSHRLGRRLGPTRAVLALILAATVWNAIALSLLLGERMAEGRAWLVCLILLAVAALAALAIHDPSPLEPQEREPAGPERGMP